MTQKKKKIFFFSLVLLAEISARTDDMHALPEMRDSLD